MHTLRGNLLSRIFIRRARIHTPLGLCSEKVEKITFSQGVFTPGVPGPGLGTVDPKVRVHVMSVNTSVPCLVHYQCSSQLAKISQALFLCTWAQCNEV